MESKVEAMKRIAYEMGYEPKCVDRVIGPYEYGEAIIAVGVDGEFEDELNRNQVEVTVAHKSRESFCNEVREAFEQTDVEFLDSDEQFEIEGGSEQVESDNQETKSFMEW